MDTCSVATARSAEGAPSDSTWVETLAVYDQIQSLLDSGRTDDELTFECQELCARLVELHRVTDQEDAQRMAIWAARNPIPWKGGAA